MIEHQQHRAVSLDDQRRSVHLTGILGAGMSALARLYLECGYRVSGSDIDTNQRLAPLVELGADVTIGQTSLNGRGVDQLVFSPAIPRDNPERVSARHQDIPTVARASALSDLLKGQNVIGVAGSHGKTTTTSLLAFILEQSMLRPGYMVGGTCSSLDGGNARWNAGSPFVNEACEAFRALDYWEPQHCIVTNIDDEHSDHYGGYTNLKAAFAEFIGRTPATGQILLCAECDTLNSIAVRVEHRAETYGFGQNAHWRADIIQETQDTSIFDVFCKGEWLERVTLSLPGKHNVLNALAAIAMASRFGVSTGAAAQCLARFKTVNRRWQPIGQAKDVRVFDDMAHHPTEIAATLAVARKTCGRDGRVVAVFQPQLYSRVLRLTVDFANALSCADFVVLLPIDSAGEPENNRDCETRLQNALRTAGVRYGSALSANEASRIVRAQTMAGDVVVTMGPDLARQSAQGILDALRGPDDWHGVDAVLTADTPAPDAVANGHRLQTWFEQRVTDYPDAACVIEGDITWTYADIDRMACRVAQNLLRRGVGRDCLVALSMNRSAKLVALILGTLKAGCAFVPIDPTMLRSNLLGILEQNGAALIVHDQEQDFAARTTVPAIDLDSFLSCANELTGALAAPAHDSDLAYAIFTSGSTGTPRLVGVEHRNVCNLIGFSITTLFEPSDLALSAFIDSISFDGAVHQIFSTLSVGGCLLVEADLTAILHSRHFSRITKLGGTPSVISKMLAFGELPDTLRTISLGGEVIPENLIATLKNTTNVRKVYNFYGPTETTIFSTVARLLERGQTTENGAWSPNNIGFPVSGSAIHIVDEHNRIAPVGTIGEILISGAGVARGYLGEPEKTAERFATESVEAPCVGRMYRTGDLGRRMPDGSIEFVGRKDDQLKIKGVRIDPEEIEAHLNACSGIERAAVVATKDETQVSNLLAFVTCDGDTDLVRVRAALARQLPPVMVPHSIVRVQSLPMTASGKLKRKDLRQDDSANDAVTAATVALDGVEKRLMEIWRSVLRRPHLENHDDFFDQGGDSLASMEMIMSAEKAFGVRLPAQALADLGTVSDMAFHIRGQMAKPDAFRAPKRDLLGPILNKQRAYLASWKCERNDPESYIRSLNIHGKRDGFFWCFQGFPELRAIAAAMGPDQPVHGMRSGHLIMKYTPDTIRALAEQYCADLIRLQPEGPFKLGGNCQGATIARATALALRARGRVVSHIVLMEQSVIWPYDQTTGLIFGRDSSHNPFSRHQDPDAVFRTAYPVGYSCRIVDGGHGSFFSRQNIASLGQAIQDLMST